MAIQTAATPDDRPSRAEKLASELNMRLAGPVARAVIRRHLIAIKRCRRGTMEIPCRNLPKKCQTSSRSPS